MLGSGVRLERHHINFALIAADITLAAGLMIALAAPRSATFSIDARTEYLVFEVAAGPIEETLANLPVDLDRTGRLWSGDPSVTLPRCRDARLEMSSAAASSARYTVRSMAEGPPEVQVSLVDEAASLGALVCPGGAIVPAPSRVSLLLAGERPRLVFRGPLTVGALPPDAQLNPPLLQSGSLSVTTTAAPFANGSATQSRSLGLADEVTFVDAHGKPATAHGVIAIDGGVLHVVAYALASEARVLRPGLSRERALVVAPTMWARVQAQSDWPLIAGLGALALHLLGLVKDLLPAKASPPAPRRAYTPPRPRQTS